MRIHILSDLHNEFGQPFVPVVHDVDLVILAGDIDVKTRGIEWARQTFSCPVAYVPGNHEYYGGHFEQTRQKMIVAGDDRVRVLDCDEMIVGNVRVLGATGWTDFTATGNPVLASWDAQNAMSDYQVIRAGSDYRRLRPEDTAKRAGQTRAWLRAKLDESFEGKTIVATHHAPSTLSLRDQGRIEDHLSAAYANRWEDLFDGEVALWVHGHSHAPVDYECAGTRVISNPRGYPGETDAGFCADLVIDIQ